ncbi:hypothetical protein J6590_018878 [Homalodisca vitripennis]|nr:hypothetical protein J6590_018878 [Homalodisca vitripennis]
MTLTTAFHLPLFRNAIVVPDIQYGGQYSTVKDVGIKIWVNGRGGGDARWSESGLSVGQEAPVVVEGYRSKNGKCVETGHVVLMRKQHIPEAHTCVARHGMAGQLI